MIQAIICEDNAVERQALHKRILALKSAELLSVTEVSCGEELMRALDGGAAAAIVFMDIELGEESGIALAKQLNLQFPRVQIIYCTAHIDYCVAVYETEHSYFLHKPFTEEQLSSATERALARLQAYTCSTFLFKANSGLLRIPAQEILWAESVGRNVHLHTEGGTVVGRGKIGLLSVELGAGFLHCHKSFLANIEAVYSLHQRCLTMRDGTVVPISQSCYRETRNRVLTHLGNSL